MDELPIVPLAAAVAVVLIGPARRRALATGAALGRTAATLVVASGRGIGDITRAAVTGTGQAVVDAP